MRWMDVRRDVDGIGLDQTFLYMTVLLHSLALVFLLACGLVLVLVLACPIRSCGDTAKNLFICPVLDDGYGFLVG
jgi:hypothetical protein